MLTSIIDRATPPIRSREYDVVWHRSKYTTGYYQLYKDVEALFPACFVRTIGHYLTGFEWILKQSLIELIC